MLSLLAGSALTPQLCKIQLDPQLHHPKPSCLASPSGQFIDGHQPRVPAIPLAHILPTPISPTLLSCLTLEGFLPLCYSSSLSVTGLINTSLAIAISPNLPLIEGESG